MSITPNYVPRPYKTVNVMLLVNDAHRALKVYNSAFRAEVVMKLEDPEGRIIHAEMRIEDTIIMVAEAMHETSGSGIVLQIYTGDVEGTFEAAIAAGFEVISPIEKQYYGDRAGRVKDPFGYEWIIATHIEDLTARELQKRFNESYP